MASPAFRRKMDLLIFKIQLHSNKLVIFKHHVKSLLLMFEYGHLQIKQNNRRVWWFLCLFVQATNESNWKNRVKSLIQRTYFSIKWRSLTLPESILLWWQPSFSSSGEAGTKICKSPCMVTAVQGIFGLKAYLHLLLQKYCYFKSSIHSVWKWHNSISAWHPYSHLLTVTSVAIFL